MKYVWLLLYWHTFSEILTNCTSVFLCFCSVLELKPIECVCVCVEIPCPDKYQINPKLNLCMNLKNLYLYILYPSSSNYTLCLKKRSAFKSFLNDFSKYVYATLPPNFLLLSLVEWIVGCVDFAAFFTCLQRHTLLHHA